MPTDVRRIISLNFVIDRSQMPCAVVFLLFNWIDSFIEYGTLTFSNSCAHYFPFNFNCDSVEYGKLFLRTHDSHEIQCFVYLWIFSQFRWQHYVLKGFWRVDWIDRRRNVIGPFRSIQSGNSRYCVLPSIGTPSNYASRGMGGARCGRNSARCRRMHWENGGKASCIRWFSKCECFRLH